MVSLKTKVHKHFNDNEKRCKALNEKVKVKLTQSNIIKQALSNQNLHNSSATKIIFDDKEDANECSETKNEKNNISKTKLNCKKLLLDNNSDSEEEVFEIKEKPQFHGKQGIKLLNLQSSYGNDERFKIDERFINDSDLKRCEYSSNLDNNGSLLETSKNLKVLEDIIGKSVSPTEKLHPKKRVYEMIRYDASKKDHEKYELKSDKETESHSIKKKRKEKNKFYEREMIEDKPKVETSKEKFYEISSDIKSAFKEKSENSGTFSFLQMYGNENFAQNKEEENVAQENLLQVNEDEVVDENKKATSETDKTKKSSDQEVLVKGIWKENFFLTLDDSRFKEGLEFINKKGSEEAATVADNYHENRKKLRIILRSNTKKQTDKKNPFKNKIGGSSKKQLTSMKDKNGRKIPFKKRTEKWKSGWK